MRAVIQRVHEAWVDIEGQRVAHIGAGALVLLGVEQGDTEKQCLFLSDKILNLRIFDDEQGKMNLSLLDTRGDLLVVSQFTLLGNCRKGRRPSYASAAPSEEANRLYELFVSECGKSGLRIATGVFKAHMDVGLINSGPVTLIVDTPEQS